jgi:aquaporin related protein
MPRIPGAYREPKPPPTRSRSQNSSHRNTRDERRRQNGNASPRPRNESDYDVPAPEPKKRISTLEGHLVAASGEFVGTFMFLFFSFSGQLMITNQASERSILNGGTSSQQNIFTALVYGFSLLVNVWAFFRISGGLFNPAVCKCLMLSLVGREYS